MTKKTFILELIVLTSVAMLSGSYSVLAQSGSISPGTNRTEAAIDRLYEQVLGIYGGKDPAVQASRANIGSGLRCGTMILAEAQLRFQEFSAEQKDVLGRLSVRPILPLDYVSPSGRFRIHYALSGFDAVSSEDLDNNSIPDFVEQVAEAFDASHALIVDQMGYRDAPSDQGADGSEYDVYIESLNLYGYSQPEFAVSGPPNNDITSYIGLDNDFNNGHFTTGIDGARVTAAHEYYHAVQFGYSRVLSNNEAFYYELCAVWMEDVAYDDINDYYQYLPGFFRNPQIPFNLFDSSDHYLGEAIWYHAIVKKFDNGFDIVRRTWELIESQFPATRAMNEALLESDTSLSAEFADFALWNYFTGSRANSIDYYDEADAYPEIKIDRTLDFRADTTVTDSSLSLTHKYYNFNILRDGPLGVTGVAGPPENWTFGAIVREPNSGVPNTFLFDLNQGQGLGDVPRSSVVTIIAINQKVGQVASLNSDFSSFSFDLTTEIPNSLRGITSIYPNPFIKGRHGTIRFEFTSSTSQVDIAIVSADGRIVKSARPTFSDSYEWDGLNDDDQPVSSGIYMIQVKQEDFTDLKKFAVIFE